MDKQLEACGEAQYGEAKAGGRLRWNGHWIAAREGAPIQAVAQGRIVYVGWMHRYGLIVLIEHDGGYFRSEEHTSELQSLMRISYAVFCLQQTNINKTHT